MCWFVSGDISTGAPHVLQLQLSPLSPSPLAPIKSRMETFRYRLTQVHLESGRWKTERERIQSCRPAEGMFAAAVNWSRELRPLLTVACSSAAEPGGRSHRQSELLWCRAVAGDVETNGTAAAGQRAPLDERVCVNERLIQQWTGNRTAGWCLMALSASDILVLKLISVLVFILFSSQNFYFIVF